jgi:hypothetical protein
MAPIDDFSRTPRKRDQVDLVAPEVVLYWTTILGCTEGQLRAAVAAVGNAADDVRAYLAKP